MKFKPAAVEAVRDEAVVIVDTFSTGAMLADLIYKKGFKVICVLSGDLAGLLDMIPEGLSYSFTSTIILNSSIEPGLAINDVVMEIKALNIPIAGVIAGAETGVELADEISERMGLRSNGTALSEARRNKFVMGETIRSAGIRAVKQLKASTWTEIAAFLDDWKPVPFKVIVKPLDSAGSDDVTLCLSMEDVKAAFGNIMGKVNGLGLVNRNLLVQEFLEGQEYVVDSVSRDGVHKVVAIWAYDRRAANGASFVCFGQRLLTSNDEHCDQLIAYMKKVLDALGIKNGPSHGEVKWCKGEPVLVEVGARCHGGDGLWVNMASECFGTNQAEAAMFAYLFPEEFQKIPMEPSHRKMYGAMKWLVSYRTGEFHGLDPSAASELTSLESYRKHQIFASKTIKKTENCFSWAGAVVLVHSTEAGLQRDYATVERLESTTLFDVTEAPIIPTQKQAVAIVDPFSTGALLAAELYASGFLCIAIYSEQMDKLENLRNLVPKGLNLVFEAVISYNSDKKALVESIRKLGFDVPAVLAGAETGVELADELTEIMGLRSNGTALSEARRNKFVMGETIRSAGIRAVKQLKASTWAEIAAFLDDWKPVPFKVIVKPLDSAGSDGVTLCLSREDVEAAYHNIIGKVNGLGLVNRNLLVQEFLEGQEYVVDSVSRDGVHKVVAIWAYDRRAINGASFICHGQQLLIASDEPCSQLIAYMKKVLDALGIMNGPSHGEVKWFNNEAVLVEVGARCHGGEGAWKDVCDFTYGFDQVQVTMDAYLHPENFLSAPNEVRCSLSWLISVCN